MAHDIEFVSHDVRKNPIFPEEVLKILATKNRFYEKRGKKVKFLDREKDAPTEEMLLKMFLGRSGKLRAPVIAAEDWIMAGFEENQYRKLLGIDEETEAQNS